MKAKIRSILENRKVNIEGGFKSTAGLLLLCEIDGISHIILEKRSSHLNSQPGEISLPGGKLEDGETELQCAIRETEEELGISRENIEVLGELDTLITPFNLIFYPFAAFYNAALPIEGFNRDEVESLIYLPLPFLLSEEPEEYKAHSRFQIPDEFPYHRIPNGKDYDFKKGKYPILFYEYDNEVIWGITARILYSFKKMITGSPTVSSS